MDKQLEFKKDLEARRQWHKMCNYHYLSYKGISLLNHTYSKDVLESLGLQIHIPRTFMTIEAIRPDLRRPIDITAKPQNRTEKLSAERAASMLKGEWRRSDAKVETSKAKFDALLFGSGYLLSYYDLDEEITEVFKNYDKEGKPVYEKGKQKNYEGMRVKWLNPYYVIPDRKAKTYEHGTNTSPRHIWVVAIWDNDVWLKECKKKGYKTDGYVKGGDVEEYDSVKREIDALYSKTITDLKTRDNGVSVSPQQSVPSQIQDDNATLVVTEYTPTEVNIFAGANFKQVHNSKNKSPIKRIPIYVLKDYDVPGELEGIGEAEVIRWQQYEENKIHNLLYLQVILNTVNRYGIIEELLADPTQVKMNNPLLPIRLKYMQGVKINDAIQVLNQPSASNVPLNVLNEVKTIGQMASGQTDYSIGASKGEAGTLGEADMMQEAGSKRIREKIQSIEETAVIPILKSWLASIPQLYTEELDYLLNDGVEKSVKFLPFNREMNTNAKIVSQYAVKHGAMKAKTLEEVFLSIGYTDVVFVSDLIGSYDITIKTALSFSDRQETIRQYQAAIGAAELDNQRLIALGMHPKWDITKLTEELLRQFDEIIDDVEQYKMAAPAAMPGAAPGLPVQGAAPLPQVETIQPSAEPASFI